MTKKAYSSSCKSKETSQHLIANRGHHVTAAHKEKLYHLIGPYMKFSLMKDKRQIMPFRNYRGRQTSCTRLGQFSQERFTQATLQQTDLRKWENKNLNVVVMSWRTPVNPHDGAEHLQDNNVWTISCAIDKKNPKNQKPKQQKPTTIKKKVVFNFSN